MSRSTRYRRPAHRPLNMRPVPKGTDHPFNMVRPLLEDEESAQEFDRFVERILDVMSPANQVKLRAGNRRATTILSRKAINLASQRSPALQEIATEDLKGYLEQGLPPSSKRKLSLLRPLGLMILGADDGYSERSLALKLDSPEIENEHHAAITSINGLGQTALFASNHPAHLSIARFRGTLPDKAISSIEKAMPSAITLAPVKPIDQTQNWQLS